MPDVLPFLVMYQITEKTSIAREFNSDRIGAVYLRDKLYPKPPLYSRHFALNAAGWYRMFVLKLHMHGPTL